MASPDAGILVLELFFRRGFIEECFSEASYDVGGDDADCFSCRQHLEEREVR